MENSKLYKKNFKYMPYGLRNQQFADRIGYSNSVKINEETRCRVFNLLENVDILRSIKNKLLDKSLLLDPANAITLIQDVFDYSNITHYGQGICSLVDMLLVLNQDPDVRVMSPFNFIAQDIVDVVLTGKYVNFRKYEYTTQRDYVISTFNPNIYTIPLNLKIDRVAIDRKIDELPTLIKVLGLEETAYLFVLLINFGFIKW